MMAEWGTCSFTGTRQVRYGGDGKYAYKNATGSISCTNTSFGDPAPGSVKTCSYAADAPAAVPAVTWTRCASEWGVCSFSGTRQIRYGTAGKYAFKTATGSIQCTNGVFGDPAPGSVKTCDYSTTAAPPAPPTLPPTPAPTPVATWTNCAKEWGVCSFPGTSEVRYGGNGSYAYKTATGSIQCDNSVFGDPAPGAEKVCEYANSAPPLPTTPEPYGQDASLYTLSFDDEFVGNALDSTKWTDHIWYDQATSTHDYAVGGGSLKIWPERNSAGQFAERILVTDKKYYQTYGYFEMEAKLPIGAGSWPAFWLLNSDSPTNGEPEIDIMEAYSGDTTGYWGDANKHPIRYGATFFENGAANVCRGRRCGCYSTLGRRGSGGTGRLCGAAAFVGRRCGR